MVDSAAEVASLRAEVERLRRLVGPCEQSYDDLRADLVATRDAAKSAEQAAGELRGELTEANAALDRALVGAPAFAYLAATGQDRRSAARSSGAPTAPPAGRRRARYSGGGAGVR